MVTGFACGISFGWEPQSSIGSLSTLLLVQRWEVGIHINEDIRTLQHHLTASLLQLFRIGRRSGRVNWYNELDLTPPTTYHVCEGRCVLSSGYESYY